MLAVLGLAYIVSQFLRHSPSVIGPNLMTDLDIQAAQLGGLGAAFFIAFALSQIPAGILLDHWGPRKSIIRLMGLAVIGTPLFAFAKSYELLLLARILMGIGCSTILMGAIVLFGRWFAESQTASLTGLILAMGGLGQIGTTAPLAWATGKWGWDGAMAGFAVIAAIIMGLVILFLREAPKGEIAPRPTTAGQPAARVLRESLKGLGTVLRHPELPKLMPMQFVAYGSVMAVIALWAGPWLSHVYGLDLEQRGLILMGVTILVVLSQLTYPQLDRIMNSRKRPILIGSISAFVVLMLMALWRDLPLTGAIILLCGLALCSGYFSILMAHSRSLFDAAHAGRGVTTFNAANMGGVAFLQWLGGIILEWVDGDVLIHSADGYRWVFFVIAFALLAGLVVYSWVDDRPPVSQK